ncbi:MAG: prepilin peptidase [Candidatus Omnitrophota bacterium]
MSEEFLLRTFIFLFGLAVGSFLNVCIVRIPQGKSIVAPRSQCVRCQKMIPWYDNIPLLSYLLLRGRCRFCREKISFRYFIVEFLTAVLFLMFYLRFGMEAVLFPYLVMLCGLIISTFVDFEHRIIPDEISLGGMAAGLVFSFILPSLHFVEPLVNQGFLTHLSSLGRSLLGVLVGGGSIYLLGLMGDFIFKKESMGGGDVKLMAMVGAFVGWKLVLLSFFIAPFFGAVYGIIEKIRTKESTIAYGPFLALGTLISLFGGEIIISWILRGYGLQ